MDKPKLWTKNFCINAAANLIVYMVYYFLMVTIASYAANNLNATPSQAGLASGIFIIGALAARVVTGKYIDRAGRKRVLTIGLLFYIATTFLYFVANNLALLLAVRLLHGVGFGIAGTATGTIAAGIIPTSRHGEGISYYAMSATLASAVGPFLGMFLIGRGNFSMILVMSVALLSVCFIAALFLKVPEAELSEEEPGRPKGYRLDSFFESKAVPVSVVSLSIGLVFSSILGFLNTYTNEINLNEAGSVFFIVYAVSILVSRPLTGKWFDRRGENFVMYPSFVLFCAGLVVLSQAHHSFSLLSAGVLVGFGYGTFLSAAQAIAVRVSPGHRKGLATSTFFSFLDGGIGIGPFLLGFLIPRAGFRVMYLMMAVSACVCGVLYFYLHGKKAHREEVIAGSSLRQE